MVEGNTVVYLTVTSNERPYGSNIKITKTKTVGLLFRKSNR